ncbi:hypothetical protein BD310DRAFT_971218 [Dichomitus squalens]|uniref:F-box domain-containing protein n=1 Tax=Dichomitus squalens TaxID=114155 RepID=A0A4Q9PE58_9APHY|nr:hypothetical protein BD310DRAFT_971218 [Dichomitus squalens]
MDVVHPPSPPISRHIPVDVCENIIDHLYSHSDITEQVDCVRALRRCALVCGEWRVRSQVRLFYCVVLHDAEALQTFAAVLDTAPHLRDYVHEVTLVGRTLHTTASPLSPFPIVLYGKLPRLEELWIRRVDDEETWYPIASRLETGAPLLCLPLHPRFPIFLSAFSTVTRLSVSRVTFQRFSDLIKMAISLPQLQDLLCDDVRCLILGPLPTCMKPQSNETRASDLSRSAPNLQFLDTDMHCVNRIISAYGPRLRRLSISLPFFEDHMMDVPEDLITELAVGIDLSPCPTLDFLRILVNSEFVRDGRTAMLQAMLKSWKAEVSLQTVYLVARAEDQLHRQQFTRLLSIIGLVLEKWLLDGTVSSVAAQVSEHDVRRRVSVGIHDRQVWRDWWWKRLEECFPTFARFDALQMDYATPQGSHSKWKNHDLSPSMPPTNSYWGGRASEAKPMNVCDHPCLHFLWIVDVPEVQPP